jgi:hypothetical protein
VDGTENPVGPVARDATVRKRCERGTWLVAIVILRPEEADIAVYGSLPEPGFRPFPGSVRERELEEEWEREQLAYLDEEDDEEEDKEEERSVEATPVEQFTSIPAARTLPRIGPAQMWKRSAREIARLVSCAGNSPGKWCRWGGCRGQDVPSRRCR